MAELKDLTTLTLLSSTRRGNVKFRMIAAKSLRCGTHLRVLHVGGHGNLALPIAIARVQEDETSKHPRRG